MSRRPPATTWKEIVPEGEDAAHRALADLLGEMQTKRDANAEKRRALHPKANAGMRAELEILPDLPPEARVAIFAEPRTYKAYARLSNGSFRPQADRKPDVRGIAVKVLGVSGKKLIPGMEDETTQDFLAIRDPSVPFRTAREFVALVRIAASPLALFSFLGEAGFFRGLGLLRDLTRAIGRPVPSIAATRFYSALPIRLGAHAAKYCFTPTKAADGPTPEDLGAELAGRLREGPVAWDLQLQLYVDDAATPIEDPTVLWSEEASPWITVGRLTLPKQDLTSEQGQRVADAVEAMSFDPWHAAEELRPLGEMMRARSHAYRVSNAGRGVKGEPRGEDWVG